MTTPLATCALCGLSTAFPIVGLDDQIYCCPACREVASLLGEAPSPSATLRHPSNTTPIELTLGGLWCSSCAWLVQETLRRAPGVQDVAVSFLQRRARITIDPTQTSGARLVHRIRRLGYTAGMADAPSKDEEESLFTRLAFCGVFVLHDVIISSILYVRTWLQLNTPQDATLITFFQAMMLLGVLPLLVALGIPIVRAGLAGLLRGRPDMHSLITIGVVAAIGISLRNLALGSDHVYFDTASMLLFLVALGRWLELRAHRSGGAAIQALTERLPKEATWLTPHGEQQIAPELVPLGAQVRVRPGESFPVDGLIAAGDGDIDESLLTGEPKPVARGSGDRVLAGTFSLDGQFDVVVTATGVATTAGKIGQALHQALWERSPVERLADRLAAFMVPAACVLALGAFIFWSLQVGVEAGLLVALTVLLIACPCALGIATPLALSVGLGRAAESGAILRSTTALERLAAVRGVFFDKTGTLTQLPLRVLAVATEGITQMDLLTRVAAVESGSEHPLAQALVAAAQHCGISVPDVAGFRAWHGQGVAGCVDGTQIWVGSERLLAGQRLRLSASLTRVAAAWAQAGWIVIFAGWEQQVMGIIGLGEELRGEAMQTIGLLHQEGLDVEVLSGDTPEAGMRWEALLGIPVHAGLMPEQKMERLRKTAGPIAMVGDGINDGPALAAASVGITMSKATDLARATADVVLLSDDLRTIPWLVQLARQAMRTVYQNLAWAFVYNLIGLALALSGMLQPVLAAVAMVLSSVLVTGNALRLRQMPIPASSDVSALQMEQARAAECRLDAR